MNGAIGRKLVGAMVASMMLAACSGNGGSVPGVTSAAAGAAKLSADAAPYNLSGQYRGKFIDNTNGTGRAKASYAQFKSGVGGALTIKYASSSVASSVALNISGSGVDGTTIMTTGPSYCTYSTTATYDPTHNVLSGTYAPVHGCTGGGGSFTLHHLCYYKGTRGGTISPDAGPRPC